MDFTVESLRKFYLPFYCILGWLTFYGVSLNTSKMRKVVMLPIEKRGTLQLAKIKM